MISCPNMLMIGGNARHAGKTTLACSVIRRFALQHEIIGLKVSRIKPVEDQFHGNHDKEPEAPFTIREEIKRHSEKDTSQMLRAGAARVYYIRAEESHFEEAVTQFLKMAGNSLIVCESRSLRTLVRPGLFILMMRILPGQELKEMSSFLEQANDICYSANDQSLVDNLANRISFLHHSWYLAAPAEPSVNKI